jgi:PPK2 family polyphosphate:nucleotide phosphotransferase
VGPFRVADGRRFKLSSIDPGDTLGLEPASKEHARQMLADGVQRLAEEQAKLYAEDRWSVLLIFQAMDAAGKDGTIKHVLTGVNPAGVSVNSFKAPSEEELDHDFMWRCMKALPERGRIGIFNRSYYEETLIVRVHQELLGPQRLPQELVTKNIWKERFEAIRAIERYLARNGCIILKFFLHVSREEQRRRFLSRLDEPEKNWKFSTSDVRERAYWSSYMEVYEDAIRNTAAAHAPWFVVPADHKWFTRMVVASAIVEAIGRVRPQFPKVGPEREKEHGLARKMLLAEKGGPARKAGKAAPRRASGVRKA